MKKYKYIIIALFVLSSCTNIFEQKEYISVYIVNHTGEQLLVYAGLNIVFISIPSTTIPTGNGQSVMVVKGESVSVSGKVSGKNYGSKTFYTESQWDIYY
ncbi:MAG: hypothetical protein LBH20_07730 [Treponema sp.]|jgi:hypothetical protein|nr:hypothetical protein [Treponema sp.]